MPMVEVLEAERILDTRFVKRTKEKEYLEFLVKWKDTQMEDYTWVSVAAP